MGFAHIHHGVGSAQSGCWVHQIAEYLRAGKVRTLNVSAEEIERLLKTQIIVINPCLLDPMGIRVPSCRGGGGGVMY
jgi:hypothetical protein